jgi:hypothetical protein
VGRIAGATGSATYSYTANGCTQTYDATFALPESDLELSLHAPKSSKMIAVVGGDFARVFYRVVVTNGGASTSPAATVVLRFSRPLFRLEYYTEATWPPCEEEDHVAADAFLPDSRREGRAASPSYIPARMPAWAC